MNNQRLVRTISCTAIALFLGIVVMLQPSSQVFAEPTALTAAEAQTQSPEKAKRTVMLYLCGSDLENGYMMGTHNLKQILGSNFSARGDVRLIVMTGGSKKWYLGEEETKEGRDNPYLYDPVKQEAPRAISAKKNQIWEARGADSSATAPDGTSLKSRLELLPGY